MDNILLSTALMIAILSSSNVFATTPEILDSNLISTKLQQQSVRNFLADFGQDKFAMPGSERIFNPQPEPPGKAIKHLQQGGDKAIIIND